MTFRSLLCVVLSLLTPVAVVAQPSPVHLVVDIPDTRPPAGYDVRLLPIPVPFAWWYVAGWALNCYTGQQPASLRVFYSDTRDGQIVNVEVLDATIHWRLNRPDVLSVAPLICVSAYVPAVHLPTNPYLGFAIGFPTPIPPGRRTITVRAFDPVFQPTTDPSLGTKYWQTDLLIYYP